MNKITEVKRFTTLTFAEKMKQIKADEKARKAAKIEPTTLPLNKPAAAAPTKPPIAPQVAPKGSFDPMANKYAGGSADKRATKRIYNAVSDFETGSLKASDARHKEIAAFAQKQFKVVNDFIKKKFGLPDFNIKASLVWDGAADGITAGTDLQATKPFCFFDFSRYYKNPGDINKWKWKRLEYDEMDTDPIIGSVYNATWQDCVTISICHEFSHAVQACKDMDSLHKIVEALPRYKGNCDDGLHGEFFKAIYRCVRGNIMGTKKEEKYHSFSEFLDEARQD